MSFLEKLRNLIEEPPPAFAFELGSNGIAHWQAGSTKFEACPNMDLHHDAGVLAEALGRITPAPNGNRKRAAALILPDKAARVTLMDFDQFPRKAEDQAALIRLRLKRTVPFDVDTAILRYQVIPKTANKVDLTVAAIAVETLAPYETAFRNAGFHAGFVTISGLSAANLADANSLTMRLSGLTLTISHFENQVLRLYRCLELQSGTMDEILNVLDPTLAYLEDERKTKPPRIDVCGLGELGAALEEHLRETWSMDVQPLRSRLGAVDANNAGLLGYLEATGVN
jgi:type IV pilus assembly protein PilM